MVCMAKPLACTWTCQSSGVNPRSTTLALFVGLVVGLGISPDQPDQRVGQRL